MEPIEIDEKATYRVALARPVAQGSFKMLPRDTHEWQGPFLRQVVEAEGWDAIASAEAIDG